jgi:hypothetical protein
LGLSLIANRRIDTVGVGPGQVIIGHQKIPPIR